MTSQFLATLFVVFCAGMASGLITSITVDIFFSSKQPKT